MTEIFSFLQNLGELIITPALVVLTGISLLLIYKGGYQFFSGTCTVPLRNLALRQLILGGLGLTITVASSLIYFNTSDNNDRADGNSVRLENVPSLPMPITQE